MNNYIVYVKEIHNVPIKVLAVDEDDALQKAENLEGDWIIEDSEFEQTMDPSEWVVELCKEQDSDLSRVDSLNKKIDNLKLMLSDGSINEELVRNGIADLEEEILSLNNSLWSEINEGENNA